MTAAPYRAGPDKADSAPLVVLLVGRPNSGKSSLFNAVTGGDAKVGNFPGVTVDVLEAEVELPDGTHASVVDLPGVYSLADASDDDTDEGQARAFIDRAEKSGDRVVIAQVIDGTQLALGLRLTKQVLARSQRTLLVVTQRDALAKRGYELSPTEIERALGATTIGVSSNDRDVRDVVLRAIADVASLDTDATRATADFDEATVVALAIHEKDHDKRSARARRQLTDQLDRWLLHPWLGPVAFVIVMATLFSAVFLIADPASSAIDAIMSRLGDGVTGVLGDGFFGSLLKDGALGGAGTVLAFLPQIVILTVALELIEASGYLARGAFLIDRALKAVRLGGRSFVPLLTAHACAVPAIAATRIIRDPRQRLRTMLVLPLMTCSARIPTYSLLIGTFFASKSALFRGGSFVLLYFAGIFLGGVASLVIGKVSRESRGHALPLVLEMPPYRRPRIRTMATVAWRATTRFVREVGSVILAASIVLWVLLRVPGPHTQETAPEDASPRVVAMHHSVAAWIGHEVEPVTKPLGFDWRINVGLIGSFGARELMVSTMGVIFGIEDTEEDEGTLKERIHDAKDQAGKPAYSALTAASLMAFFVIACQCMSTVAALKRETRSYKWPAFVLGYTYVLAYAAALIVYQGGKALGWG
jgi:ferrous iron transport protein B